MKKLSWMQITWKRAAQVAGLALMTGLCAADTVNVKINGVTVTADFDPGTSSTDLSDVYVLVTITPQIGSAKTLKTPVIANVPIGSTVFSNYQFDPVTVEKGPVTVKWEVWDQDLEAVASSGSTLSLAPTGEKTLTLTGGTRTAIQTNPETPALTDVNANRMSVSQGFVPCDSQAYTFEHIALLPGAASAITARCTPKAILAPTPLDPQVMANVNAKDWTLRLSYLWVSDDNEDSDDEPYFVVIPFRSQFATPGSTEVIWNGHLEEMEALDSENNAYWQPIPQKMGYARFHNVIPVTSMDRVRAGLERPEILGALIFSMESDATPFSTISGMMYHAVDSLRNELVNLVESAAVPPTQEQLEAASANVVNSIKSYVMQDWLGFFVESWTDPDSVIGYHTFVLASSLDPALGDALPESSVTSTIGLLQEMPSQLTLTFDGADIPQGVLDLTGGDDTRYLVSVEIKSSAPTTVPPPGTYSTSDGISQLFPTEKIRVIEAIAAPPIEPLESMAPPYENPTEEVSLATQQTAVQPQTTVQSGAQTLTSQNVSGAITIGR